MARQKNRGIPSRNIKLLNWQIPHSQVKIFWVMRRKKTQKLSVKSLTLLEINKGQTKINMWMAWPCNILETSTQSRSETGDHVRWRTWLSVYRDDTGWWWYECVHVIVGSLHVVKNINFSHCYYWASCSVIMWNLDPKTFLILSYLGIKF